jgi:hypothetical protein
MGLSLVSHETLVAIKPSIAKDAVNYLGEATIGLRKRTLSGRVDRENSRIYIACRSSQFICGSLRIHNRQWKIAGISLERE